MAFRDSLAGGRLSLGKEAGPELPFAKKGFFQGIIRLDNVCRNHIIELH